MAKGCPNTNNFIGGYGSSHPTATHQDAPLYRSGGHRTGKRDGKIRIVIIVVLDFVTEVNDLMTFGCQQRRKLLFHFESAVVCANTYFHFLLLCRAIWLFAAATMCSALNP